MTGYSGPREINVVWDDAMSSFLDEDDVVRAPLEDPSPLLQWGLRAPSHAGPPRAQVEILFTVSVHDRDRPSVVVTNRVSVSTEDPSGFWAWAHATYPSPRYSVRVDPGQDVVAENEGTP